jgi:hypothetical protein
MAPSEILLSVPTLEDALPPLRQGDTAMAYTLHEDDWRQHEFVARRFESEIAAEDELPVERLRRRSARAERPLTTPSTTSSGSSLR